MSTRASDLSAMADFDEPQRSRAGIHVAVLGGCSLIFRRRPGSGEKKKKVLLLGVPRNQVQEKRSPWWRQLFSFPVSCSPAGCLARRVPGRSRLRHAGNAQPSALRQFAGRTSYKALSAASPRRRRDRVSELLLTTGVEGSRRKRCDR